MHMQLVHYLPFYPKNELDCGPYKGLFAVAETVKVKELSSSIYGLRNIFVIVTRRRRLRTFQVISPDVLGA